MNAMERWFDRRIKNLGYIKAAQVPITMLHSGETTAGSEASSRYSTWTDEQIERLAITSAWVYSDIQVIGNQVSQGTFGVYQKEGEGKTAIESHPLELILEGRPNAHMSQSYIWRYTAMWLLLRGEAYWWLVSDSSGELQEIYPIPASHMQPIPDKKKYIKTYAYSPISGQPPVEIPAEQVCFFRLPNPFEYRRGLSPISAYRLILEGDMEAAKLMRNMFEKGLSLRALISLKEGMAPNEFEVAKQDIITSQKEGDQYLITRGGDLDVKSLTLTQKDAEFLASRQFNRDEIDRVYGVPEGFWSVKANRANSEQAFATLNNLTIWPLMNLLSEEITSQVLHRYYSPDLVGNFDDIRSKDRVLELKETDSQRAVMTWNEAREGEGLEPVDNGDIPFVALKDLALEWTRQNDIFDTPEPPPQLAPFTSSEPEPESGELPDDEDDETKALTDWQQLAIYRLKNRPTPTSVYLDDNIPEADSYRIAAILGHCHTEAAIKAVFEHQDEYTVKAILGEPSDEIDPERLALEDEFTPEIEAFLAEQSERIARNAIHGEPPDDDFWEEELALLLVLLIPALERWGQQAISAVVTQTLTPVGLGLGAEVNARAAAWAGDYALDLAKGLNRTTRELAKAKIKNWFAAGGTDMLALEKELAGIIAPKWRARMIAQTEVTRAYSEALHEIGKEYGIIKRYQWQTAEDERVCVICLPLHGKQRTKGGLYPGGYDGPPAHPRCRCSEMLVV